MMEKETHPECYHSVGHFSQPTRKTLGVVAHGSSPHVFGQGSENMAAARCLGDCFQHGAYLCCPGSGKSSSWIKLGAELSSIWLRKCVK